MYDDARTSDFESWYRAEHSRLVPALALVCGSTDIAAEAADEAFVRALVRWPRVGSMDSPVGWTYRVALNLVRRRARRDRLARAKLEGVVPAALVGAPAGETWLAVAALPPRQRLAVTLRYVADLTQPQIAEVMGVRRGTVASTLADARVALARMLGCPEEELTER